MQKRQRGFLIALCLCVLSVSGIYGAYQYRKGQAEEPEAAAPEAAQVQETQEEQPKEAANTQGAVAKADTEEEPETAKIETEEDIENIGEAELAKTEEPEAVPAEEAQPEAVPEEETEEESVEETAAEPSELTFSAASHLLWPVDGDVILNYSMDKSIYFSTLNQYKYHPALVISAEVGDEVRAAAAGEVKEISVDAETGTTIRTKLGNGYNLYYGQLKELAVEEGDMVEAGQLIGYVSEPTKYYTLEGSNLYFQLLKDGEPLNPLDFLE